MAMHRSPPGHAGLFAAALAILLTAAGCSAVDPRTGQADAMPVAPPARAATPYTDALYCLDQLMMAQNRGNTRQTIGAGVLPDATGRVSPGLRDMVTTALGRATRTSQAFFPTEVLTLSQVPVASVGSPLQTGGALITATPGVSYRNALQVTGALSQADRNVTSQNAQGGIGWAQNLFGISQNSDVSNVGIDLHLIDVDTRRIVQSVSNQMTVRNRSRGTNADFKIGNFGLNFELNFDDREGLHQAVRTLVELSVLELLGMQAQVPYWHCLQLTRRHGGVQRQIAAMYRGLDVRGVDDYVRRRLRVLGYAVGDQSASPTEALVDFQRGQGLIPDGNPSFETFAALVDAEQVDADKIRASSMPVLLSPTPPRPEPLGPRRLRLDVTEVAYLKPILQLSVSLDRGGALACYYRDEDGGIWRILPSRHQPSGMSSAEVPMRIPNNVVQERPVIQPDRMTPQVGFLCATGERDWAALVPAALWGEDLQRLPGADFTKLEQVFKAAGGTDVTTAQTVKGKASGLWSVVPPAGLGVR